MFQREYDDDRIEYGIIVKEYVISKDNDVTLNEFWNVFTNQKVTYPDIKSGNKTKRGILDDEK